MVYAGSRVHYWATMGVILPPKRPTGDEDTNRSQDDPHATTAVKGMCRVLGIDQAQQYSGSAVRGYVERFG